MDHATCQKRLNSRRFEVIGSSQIKMQQCCAGVAKPSGITHHYKMKRQTHKRQTIYKINFKKARY